MSYVRSIYAPYVQGLFMIKVFYINVNKSFVFLSGEFFLRFHNLPCESSESFDLIFFNDVFFFFFIFLRALTIYFALQADFDSY